MKARSLLTLIALLLGISAVVAQTPLTPLFSLRGKTDSNGALYITNFAAATPDTPLTAMGDLRGKTDSNGALYVTCTGCSGVAGADTQVQFNDGGALGGDAGLVYDKTVGRLTSTSIVTDGISRSGDIVWSLVNTGLRLASTASVTWNSGTSIFDAIDTGLERNAAGVVGVNNGTAGAGGMFQPGHSTQAALGTPADGTIVYCSDCTFANPCAGSGTGAIAKRLNGAWRCD